MTDGQLFGMPTGGIVGSRQLVAVQTINLGRLTHHPVPITPAALVAVSGTGPDGDSNGSGKTTFLAAVSLLLGDPEWHVSGSGGADALGLLFDPDLSGDAAGLWDPALYGFVAGVFARTTEDGNYDELTVWLRISADDSPRISARWNQGVHLATDRDDATRAWNAMSKERQFGPHTMVEQLYGGTGRCLAYVTSRGHSVTDGSLMQLQARLNPTRIGSELIVLLGMDHLIDGERELRANLFAAEAKLTARIDEHEQHERTWSARLADIEARDLARQSIAEGQSLWRLRTARKLLDATNMRDDLEQRLLDLTEELTQATALLDDAEHRLHELPDGAELSGRRDDANTHLDESRTAEQHARDQHNAATTAVKQHAARLAELTTASLGAPPGRTLHQAMADQTASETALRLAIEAEGAAKSNVAQAQDGLVAVTAHGDAHPATLATLRSAGIETTPVLDLIEVNASARASWEPVLAMWRGALLVDHNDLDNALQVAPPGTVIVVASHANDLPLPEGIAAAPEDLRVFLHELADRSDAPFTDRHAGVVVAGGFAAELCGREAAISRETGRLAAARELLDDAMALRERREHELTLANEIVTCLHALEALREIRPAGAALDDALAQASVDLKEAGDEFKRANHAAVQAEAAVLSANRTRDTIASEVDRCRSGSAALQSQIDGTRLEITGTDVDGWRIAWGGTDDAAASALEGDDRGEATLRRRAAERLTEALTRLGVDTRTGGGAPTAAIEQVIRAREGLEVDVPARSEVRRFDTVVQPLRDWLDELAIEDESFRTDVEAERHRWAEQIEAATSECTQQRELLDRHRDMVTQQLEVALGAVSDRYAELDQTAGGYGAKLDIRHTPPLTPTDLWTWQISPEWRRAPGGRFIPYTRQANSAMQKQQRTHLVLAALLAAENPSGRVLIIDEAGNDFGREHLRQVLSAFAQVARTHGVTVIAACQDKVLEEVAALGDAKMLLWFERRSDASPLCKPVRIWGFDPEHGRIELTRPAVEAGRLL